jgi:GT2 family glycosyltransferase
MISSKPTYEMTVSIVVYRTNKTQLRNCVESVFGNGLRVRLIVVDNSPTGRLRNEGIAAGAEYRWTGENLGFGAAHNRAIQECRGISRYHLILNPDVYFGTDVLESLVSYMDANPQVGLAMPRILYPDGSPQNLCKLLPTPTDLLLRRLLVGPLSKLLHRRTQKYELRNADPMRTMTVPVLSGCFMFLRTEIFEKVGLFDERYFMYLEDVDFCRRVHSAFDVVYYPQASVFHAYAKGSYKDWRLLWYHVKSACAYFSKWGWFVDRERDSINAKALRQAEAHHSKFSGQLAAETE